MNRNTSKHFTWIWRSTVVLGGLSLAACAPMALPASGNQPASNGAVDAVAQQGADDTATPGLTSTAMATDDTATPGMTSTAMATDDTATPGATSTPMPGVTATAVAGQEVEFIGTIESFDGGVLMVSGRKVIITAQTEVKFQPQKGLNVKVHGALQADGSVLAREIESVPDARATHQPDLTRTPRAETTREPQGTRQAGEKEFTGTVSAINGNVFIVDGITVVVTGEIKGTIAVGDLVKVHGIAQADGSVVAREIERADKTRDPKSTQQAGEIEFTGTVSAINGNVFVVDGKTVTVTGEIKGTIAVGDLVKVHGVTQADGSVVAREIEKAGSDDGDDDNSGGQHGSDDDGHDGHGGHGGDDVTPTPAPTSVDGSTPTPAPTDDKGGHGSDDNGGDDNGGHAGDDSGGHGGDDSGGHGGDDSGGHGGDDSGGHGNP